MDLYQDLMGGQASQSQPSQTTPQQNDEQFANDLAAFAKNFKGDPKQQVMNLLQQNMIPNNVLNGAIQRTNMIYKTLRGGK